MSLLDLVREQLSGPQVQQLSSQIGADPQTTERAVQAAVPLLLGGLAQHAQTPTGAQAVESAVSDHAGALGGLGALLGAAPLGDAGGGILGRVLGGHESTVASGVQQASGLDSAQTRRLLMFLAPMVLAMLAKRHANQQQQANAGVLAGTLQQEAQEAQQHATRESPQVGGILGQILSRIGASGNAS